MQGRPIDHTLFENTAFVNCKLDRVEFRQARLLNTSFAGKLDDVVFGRNYTAEPTRLENVDFSKATISYSIFPNTEVSGLVVPEDPRNHATSRFKELIAELDQARQTDASIGNVDLGEIFTSEYTAASNFGIINEDDFKDLLMPKGMQLLSEMLANPVWGQ
jgi:uncharacterized protein YjbI with pentapeptide repeats